MATQPPTSTETAALEQFEQAMRAVGEDRARLEQAHKLATAGRTRAQA